MVLDATFTDDSQALIRATIQPASIENYAAWAAANIPNASDRDALDDPDNDGVANLAEFAAGTDPMEAGGENAPDIILLETANGQPVLEATFSTPLPSTGVTFEVQVSKDLITWTDDIEIVSATLTGGGMQEVVAREIPSGNTNRCYLRVSLSE